MGFFFYVMIIKTGDMKMNKERIIDMVIPYVDNTDKVWQKAYTDFCTKNKLGNKMVDMYTDRYQDIGLINYQLKLINKYMPWVNKIYLLLMNREQAPKDLPSNVEIIYHARFIPQKYLPTFNSTTIEMFLWNIPNLSEYFIYANDDMLPFKPLKPSDFFTDEGKIKIEWWNEDINKLYNMFRQQCYNSFKHITIRLGKKTEQYKYLRPAHSFTPMIKSHCKYAYDLISDLINKHIRAFRTEYQYNQYIYPIFEKYTLGTCDSNIDFLYTQLENEIDLNHDIVCINIVPRNKEKELIEKLEVAINEL